MDASFDIFIISDVILFPTGTHKRSQCSKGPTASGTTTTDSPGDHWGSPDDVKRADFPGTRAGQRARI